MDNLIDLARKFDTANTPELREKLRAAIANSTAMEPADQKVADRLLVLGEQIQELLGESRGEFEDRYTFLVEHFHDAQNPAMGALVTIGLAGRDEVRECLCPLPCSLHEHNRPACVGCPRPVDCARHCFAKMGADGKMLEEET